MRLKQLTQWRVAFGSILGVALAASILAGCGSTSSGNGGSGGGSGTFSAAKGCNNVGVLLPETNSSPRWEGKDHPALSDALKKYLPKASVTFSNANGDATTQQNQADSDLTKGACMLVVAPKDANGSAAIVAKAKQQHVPVISYDRLINSADIAAYVSYDGVAVGKQQGQYIADHYQQYANGHASPLNMVFIKGSQDDNNAVLFQQGAHDVVDPLVNSGKLKNVYEVYTPNWNPPTAESEMEAALTRTSNDVQVVYSSNDDMAGTIIQALSAQHLAGKVLVTGQDATVPGLQRILEGTQSMTVYKDIAKEADETGQTLKALYDGNAVTSVANQTVQTPGKASVPAALLQPESIDKSNISDVVNAGYATKSDICSGIPAGTDTGGFCS